MNMFDWIFVDFFKTITFYSSIVVWYFGSTFNSQLLFGPNDSNSTMLQFFWRSPIIESRL